MTPLAEPLASYLDFIPEPEAYAESLLRPLPPYARVNTLKAPAEAVLRLLAEEGVRATAIPGVSHLYRVETETTLGTLRAYLLGWIYPQALSSALPVLALAPRAGELVLDLCAAPGGKTVYMAQLMGDQGLIVANDRKYGRLTALSANVKRMGITNTVLTFFRGDIFPPGERFDRVLVDAPCSGEGKFRLNAAGEILHRSETACADLPAIQKGLLVKAYDLVRPGGRLVYSTCTLNPMENEAVVAHLLKKRGAEILEWAPPLPSAPGLTEHKGKTFHAECAKCRRFYPHQIDSVGFFVAKISKPGR